MAMTRQERVAIHKKQEVAILAKGVPTISELSEGVPTFRFTNEGVVEYVRYRNELYKIVLEKAIVT